jgi:hypothetical protein
MKITDIQIFLMHAGMADSKGWRARNWLFIKRHTHCPLSLDRQRRPASDG